ncbi:hypothetical protein Ddc_22729 [Ditylenchus destructor]|nr:hypothetical protein Ddc_22729 [Ditylenchus destructor]
MPGLEVKTVAIAASSTSSATPENERHSNNGNRSGEPQSGSSISRVVRPKSSNLRKCGAPVEDKADKI